MDLIPFPKEPDADFARQLYASVEPIIAGCKDDEWRSRRPDLTETRNPDFARQPWTNEFVKTSFETRMQLAIAFVDMHGKEGVTPSFQSSNPRLYGLQKFVEDSDLPQWVWHEVDLRAGAMPIPRTRERQAWELAKLLASALGGNSRVLTPEPPDIPMPKDHVYIRARQWYDHTCKLIAEGCYFPPED